MIVEILTFRLAAGADEAAFLAADRRVQAEFAYAQRGLLRRTTARGDDGEWAVIDLWATVEEAEDCDTRWGEDEVTAAFMALVDQDTLRWRRYAALD